MEQNGLEIAPATSTIAKNLTWLHLSDWHQGRPSFNRSLLLKKMLEDIEQRNLLDARLANIDAVIFSGDIAFSGQQGEYLATEEDLIAPLRKILGQQVSFVLAPGNHDFDRTRPKSPSDWETAMAVANRAIGDEVGNLLMDPVSAPSLMAPFGNFIAFARKLGAGNEADTGTPFVSSKSFAGGKVRVATINTAICCARHSIVSNNPAIPPTASDYGALSISEYQIWKAIDEVNQKGVRVKILVMHHPISWMHESEQPVLEQLIAKNFDLVLYGHEHLPRFSSVSGNFGDVKFIPAGCSFAGRNPANPRYTNAFNFGVLNLEDEDGAIHHRVWQEARSEWEADDRFWPKGVARFLIQNDLLPENRRFMFDAHRRYKTAYAKRPAKLAAITLIHTTRVIDGENFLDAEIQYELELHPGKQEEYKFQTTTNKKICKHPSEAVRAAAFEVIEMSPPPNETTVGDNQHKALGSVELSSGKARIVYHYRMLETAFGVWQFKLSRFTDDVTFRIMKAPGYEYEFLPLAGFPDLKPDPEMRGALKSASLKSEGGHLPGQGYMVQWYPE